MVKGGKRWAVVVVEQQGLDKDTLIDIFCRYKYFIMLSQEVFKYI